MRQTEVDKDTELDDRYKDERQRDALLNEQYNNEDSCYRDYIDHLEVMARGGYHVVHAGCLAYQHSALIVALEYAVQLIQLNAYLIARRRICGVDKYQLVLVALKNALDAVGKYLLGNGGADNALETEHVLNTVNLLHIAAHCADLALRERRIDEQHVRR